MNNTPIKPTRDFFEDIKAFRKMYKLPTPPFPTMANERIVDFQAGAFSILGEEFLEGKEVFELHNTKSEGTQQGDHELDVLTAQADWLGDMIVYCASELWQYGLDPAKILSIIMESNASKLGADGKPIYDERGKVMKGPGYWKPEPEIRAYIEGSIITGLLGVPKTEGEE